MVLPFKNKIQLNRSMLPELLIVTETIVEGVGHTHVDIIEYILSK